MKCEKCEKELLGGAVICRECGFNNALRRLGGWRARQALFGQSRSSQLKPRKDATLIPFPLPPGKVRLSTPQTVTAQKPAWRLQLSEKIRQLREQRRLKSAESQPSAPPAELSPIVAAAINRLRRTQQPSPLASTQATGAALARAVKCEERPVPEPELRPTITLRPHTAMPHTGAAKTPIQAGSPAAAGSQAHALSKLAPTSASLHSSTATPKEAPPAWPPQANEEPAPEIRITSLGAAPLLARAAAATIDVGIITFSFLPFFTAFTLFDADLSHFSAYALAGIALGAAFLYHLLTIAIAGRTSGMALLKLRIVDAANESTPATIGQAFVRALGSTLGLVLMPLNLLVIWLSFERLSLADHLSGTIVVRQ
jgi:uncharacterized RDD family membrane protein YckC